jgi:hypothetical protein
MTTKAPTPEERKAWNYRCDNTDKFPWLVVFEDKATFPAGDQYATRSEAEDAIKARPGVLYETRILEDGTEQMRKAQ